MGTAGQGATSTALAISGGVGKAPESRLMRFYGPINDKPLLVGSRGLTGQGEALTLKLHRKRDESLTDCSSPVNHPTTPCSEMLVGETTRSIVLNSDRGGGPLNAQRIVGKREPHTGNREKLPTADGSVSHITARFWLGVIPFRNRADSPSVIGGIA
jgi:hypothetical protein